jgi:hypothetical protein
MLIHTHHDPCNTVGDAQDGWPIAHGVRQLIAQWLYCRSEGGQA